MENEAPSLDPMAATAIRTMKDIVLPAPVSWFPQTWGWAAVGIVLLAAVFAWGAFAVVHFRRNAYRRRALKVLDQIVQSSKSDPSGGEYAAELAVLMKRVALAAWGRERVAHLSGRDWADFIAMHVDFHAELSRFFHREVSHL